MGWSWAGASEWLSEKKLEERERQKWEQARKDKLVSLTLPTLIKRKEERDAKKEATTARMATADRLGFDVEAAAVLEATGQLEGILSDIDPKKANKTAIKKLSEGLLQDLDPELIGQAMKYAIDTDFLEEPSVAKYIEILYNADADNVVNVAAELGASGGRRVRPDIDTRDINTRALQGTDPTYIKGVQRTIEARVGAQLGGKIEIDSNGNTVMQFGPQPADAQKIINNAVDYYFDVTSDAFNTKDPNEIFAEISDKVEDFTSKTGDLAVIADTPFTASIVADPVQDRTVIPAADVPGTSTEAVDNALTGSGNKDVFEANNLRFGGE